MIHLVHAVFKKDNKIFAIKRNDKPLKGFYSLPGGRIEKETKEDALKRELKEELGIDVYVDQKDFLGKISYTGKNLDFTVFYFKINLEENKISLNKKEISGTKWLSIPDFCENLLKAGLNKESVNRLNVLLNSA